MSNKKSRIFFMCVDNVVVTGPVVPMPESGDPTDIVCQHCLVDTRKSVTGEIIEFGIYDDIHFCMVQCERCENAVVVEFTLEHLQYQTID